MSMVEYYYRLARKNDPNYIICAGSTYNIMVKLLGLCDDFTKFILEGELEYGLIKTLDEVVNLYNESVDENQRIVLQIVGV